MTEKTSAMSDNALDRLFSGNLNQLAPLPKRVVRLFISSTFTDMTLERNTLIESVYPKLKKYCRERHGLDFQVVDMRWGVRDEATDDHQTADLCSREIDNCQRVSLGPNFVALIGDKYGFRPLLNKIKSTEYRALRRSLIEMDMNTDFLDNWYKEDLNAIPAEYVLQPISSILKNFTNKDEPDLQMVDQRLWQAIQQRLHELLAVGSRRLVSQGRMSEQEQLMKYSISVTEREVIEGCLDVEDAKSHCLIYVRSVLRLREQLSECLAELRSSGGGTAASGNGKPREFSRKDSSATRKASLQIGDDTIKLATSNAQTAAERKLERTRRLIGNYVDLSDRDGVWQMDEEAQFALEQLKEIKLKSKFAESGRNLTSYQVEWHPNEGISLKLDEHKQYLANLTEHFYANLVRMIRNGVKNEQSNVNTSGLTGEVLQHSHYANQTSGAVRGRSAELEQIRAYVTGRHKQVLPMFVYGVDGSGKTCVLSEAARQSRNWIRHSKAKLERVKQPAPAERASSDESNWSREPCVVMRFCGTTPQSSSLVGVLKSLCRQLQYNFYQFGPLSGLEGQNAGQAGAELSDSQLPYQPLSDDPVRLVFAFRQLLDNCQHKLHRNRSFVIIIDAIERLESLAETSVAAKYSWLTSLTSLPPNVRLLVSTSSDSRGSSAEDYTYLKRHFVGIYFEQLKARLAANVASTSSESSGSGATPTASFDSSWPSSETNSLVRTSLEAGGESERGYALLRRLVLPAVRLMRAAKLRAEVEPASATSGEPQTGRLSVGSVGLSSPSRWLRRRSSAKETKLQPRRPASQTVARRAERSPQEACGQEQQIDTKLAGSRSNAVAARRHLAFVLHVRPLGAELARSVLRHWLSERGRSLTRQQWEIVGRSLARCSRPIFVKLAFREMAAWKSYSLQGDTRGLTFGSAWLNGDSSLASGLSCCRELAQLVEQDEARDSNGQPDGNALRLDTLAMERQWLNFLDYSQRRASEHFEASGGANKRRQDVSIRISGATTSSPPRGPTRQTGAGQTATPTAATISSSQQATTAAAICHLSDTIEDSICQLFARIELQHGHLLTKHSLSYVSAARNGICENELEDVLSLDDVVLDDVFQYHMPPIRRIPPLLWTRIRNDLPGYLSERDADGIVVAWHHNQFKQVARQRYLADKRQVSYIHSMLADYFLGKWAGKAKPFRCTRHQNVQLAAEQTDSALQQSGGRQEAHAAPSLAAGGRALGSRSGALLGGGGSAARVGGVSFSARSRLRSSDQHERRPQLVQAKADRRVPQQPLFYSTAATSAPPTGKTRTSNATSQGVAAQLEPPPASTSRGAERRRYNLRKLTELPFHLMKAERFGDLATNVLFNYKWLFAAIDALGLQVLLADISAAVECLGEAAAARQSSPESQTSASGGEPNRLARDELEQVVDQLQLLADTLRLSASVVHSDTQMVAPQLLGRLLPIVGRRRRNQVGRGEANERLQLLGQLLSQCDRDGCADCSLLPIEGCLQPPDGLQSSSLEGHSFAVMSMQVSSDSRHLLAISNRFLMWDVATGEIARDVDANLAGAIMRQLQLGSSNEFAVAFSSDNLVVALDVLTQQVAHFDQLAAVLAQTGDSIAGLRLIDRKTATSFLVWSKTSCFVFKLKLSEPNWNSEVPRQDSLLEKFHRISIELEYSIDASAKLDCADDTFELLDVHLKREVAFGRDVAVLVAKGRQANLLSVRTCETFDAPPAARGHKIWSSCIEANCVAVSENLCQIVYSNEVGEVLLRRRRRNFWSEPKTVRQKSSRKLDASEISDSSLAPLAIKAESRRAFGAAAERNRSDSLDLDDLNSLAEFERKLDEQNGDDEIEPSFVFKTETSGNELAKRAKRNLKVRNSSPIDLISLYFRDKVIVLRPTGKEERCFRLPQNVRNVCLEPNRCLITSLAVGSETQLDYLVVSAVRKLLVYSIESGELLKSIEAHSSRITQLVPLRAASASSDLSVASCSMDKTVKIWNLRKVESESRSPSRCGGSIESLSLASQRPLALCLARGELVVWNWQTVEIVARLSACDLTRLFGSNEAADEQKSSKVVKCKFSSNSRFLIVATGEHVYLLSVEANSRHSPTSTGDGNLNLKAVAEIQLKSVVAEPFLVRQFKFILQDTRVLTTTERAQNSHKSSATSKGAATRLVVLCHSVPDARQLFQVDLLSPNAQLSRQPDYLRSQRTEADTSGKGRRDLGGASSANSSQASGGNCRVRLPVVTIDQQTIVAVEQVAAPQTSRLVLNVYSARDGQLLRQLDLSQLSAPNSNQLDAQHSKGARPLEAPPNESNFQLVGLSLQNNSPGLCAANFTKMKAISFNDGQSTVALLDEERGFAWLADTRTKAIVARLDNWSGKLSSSGRLGLSRAASLFGGGAAASPAEGGLQLVEMRRQLPLKTLLSGEQFRRLNSSNKSETGGSSERDLLCGFTRPNDSYCFLCESRSRRLLLIRLYDSRLVANYKLSAPVTRLRCAPDGLALVLGHADGSLTPLAIVDEQASETLARLGQYPSRRAQASNR